MEREEMLFLLFNGYLHAFHGDFGGIFMLNMEVWWLKGCKCEVLNHLVNTSDSPLYLNSPTEARGIWFLVHREKGVISVHEGQDQRFSVPAENS